MVGDVTGEINFLTKTIDGCLPWVDVSATSVSASSNFEQKPTRLTIYDLRGKEKSVNLDMNAFELAEYNGSIQNEFDQDSQEQEIYYQEIIAFLKKRLGASRIVIFNHLFRSRGLPRVADQCDGTHKNPVFYPHVDLDPDGARWKVIQMLGKEEGEKAMQNRFQVINVWRPLGLNPITNKPLTICDYRSIEIEKDVHPLQVRGSSNALTAYTISHNMKIGHRWYYVSQMRPDEMFIVKIFDTNPHVSQFGFHTAFLNEHLSPSNIEEKSLEVRCLVFYDSE